MSVSQLPGVLLRMSERCAPLAQVGRSMAEMRDQHVRLALIQADDGPLDRQSSGEKASPVGAVSQLRITASQSGRPALAPDRQQTGQVDGRITPSRHTEIEDACQSGCDRIVQQVVRREVAMNDRRTEVERQLTVLDWTEETVKPVLLVPPQQRLQVFVGSIAQLEPG